MTMTGSDDAWKDCLGNYTRREPGEAHSTRSRVHSCPSSLARRRALSRWGLGPTAGPTQHRIAGARLGMRCGITRKAHRL